MLRENGGFLSIEDIIQLIVVLLFLPPPLLLVVVFFMGAIDCWFSDLKDKE